MQAAAAHVMVTPPSLLQRPGGGGANTGWQNPLNEGAGRGIIPPSLRQLTEGAGGGLSQCLPHTGSSQGGQTLLQLPGERGGNNPPSCPPVSGAMPAGIWPCPPPGCWSGKRRVTVMRAAAWSQCPRVQATFWWGSVLQGGQSCHRLHGASGGNSAGEGYGPL